MRTRKSGYRTVRCTGHPRVVKSSGWIGKHVLIAERALGRYLPNGAEVHHVDDNALNNANSNLVICQSHEYHHLLHVRARIVRAGGNPNTQRICWDCRQLKDFGEFNRCTRNKNGGLSNHCRECSRRACRDRRTAMRQAREGA